MLRILTNIICARPGEMLLLLNSCVRKALLEELIIVEVTADLSLANYLQLLLFQIISKGLGLGN